MPWQDTDFSLVFIGTCSVTMRAEGVQAAESRRGADGYAWALHSAIQKGDERVMLCFGRGTEGQKEVPRCARECPQSARAQRVNGSLRARRQRVWRCTHCGKRCSRALRGKLTHYIHLPRFPSREDGQTSPRDGSTLAPSELTRLSTAGGTTGADLKQREGAGRAWGYEVSERMCVCVWCV